MKHFRRVLIANRGEIAVRIARTCREMGISPIAVYSDADRRALQARTADEAVCIGPSYLNIERMVDAARWTRADAIHPGYGFLSEKAEFAEACERAGFVFIGPPAEVIRKMGLKTTARKIAAEAGLPIVPEGASEFPVLIKAAAGGGGRGMRIVREAGQLDEAMKSARSEAERSFGDGTLLMEKFIEGARHVEVQIFGDEHGNFMHLFERDCTAQRRFQKIVEESPCPALTEALRTRICDSALVLARSIGYVNAGTVEFLLAPAGEFYFIEVNTRIQVEHPVTELVTGLDLIQLQIEIAEGRTLPPQPAQTGHAIEARLYAEDPENEFLPSTGVIQVWRPPANVRVDTAIAEGTEIGIQYDPMLAKIVAHGPDRETAVRKLVYALRSTMIFGVKTNREYLIRMLDSEAMELEDRWFDAAAMTYLERTCPRLLRGVPYEYRNNPRVRTDSPEQAQFDGVAPTFEVIRVGEQLYIHSLYGSKTLPVPNRFPRPVSADTRQTANSPMPGQVLRILVEEGQHVTRGTALVVLEAMKMEQTIRTTINGVVKSVLVRLGQVVAPGQMLVEITSENAL